ncbi:MAG: MBL fold metallo-hydrolase [Deltaproteobacteria bacterium]|nr:MBL fold metallo-hydrolase [Deltaproteobacteria bacterium]
MPPFATAAVPIGLAGVVCAAVAPPLAPWVFQLAEAPVAAGLGVLDGIATWHGLDGTVPRAPALVAVLATALAVAALVVPARRHARLAAAAAVAVMLGAGLAPRIRAHLRTAPEVTFLAVGHGDAAVVSLPRARTWLVDAGPGLEARRGGAPSVVVPALGALGATRVDVLVASHLQLDHVGGLGALLERFDVGEIWLPAGVPCPSWLTRDLERAARRGTALVELSAATAPFERDGFAVEVLHPPRDPAGLTANDASLVLRLRTPGGSVLFAGDVEREGERLLVAAARDARADVLKVPHHGSATSSSFALLRAVAPRIAVVSAPRGSLRHPSSEVVARLTALGARVLDTGRDGAVTVRLAPPTPAVIRPSQSCAAVKPASEALGATAAASVPR